MVCLGFNSSRWLSAGLEHVHYTEAFLHEGAHPLRGDQLPREVDQGPARCPGSDSLVSGEEVAHLSVEQFAHASLVLALQQVALRELGDILEGNLPLRTCAGEEGAWVDLELRPVGFTVAKEQHTPMQAATAAARAIRVMQVEQEYLQPLCLAADDVHRGNCRSWERAVTGEQC